MSKKLLRIIALFTLVMMLGMVLPVSSQTAGEARGADRRTLGHASGTPDRI